MLTLGLATGRRRPGWLNGSTICGEDGAEQMLPRCLVMFLLSSITSFQGGNASFSISVSPLVEVELGSPLVIPCTHNSSVGDGVVTQWYIISATSRTRISYRDSRLFVADADTGYTDRIDAHRDDSALALSATVAADERVFICQVFAWRHGVAEAAASVRLFAAPTVAVAASKWPVLLNRHLHKIGECFVHNAYSEPHITWYKASLPLLPSPDVKVTRTVAKEADGTFAVTSVLRYKPEKWDVGAGYRCVVNYTMPGGRSEAVASETIYVEVHYPPERVALILESPHAAVKEGDTVVLRCHADGFPPPEVDFYRSSPTRVDYGHALAGEALVLLAVDRNHGGTYGCRVRGGPGEWPEGRVDLLVNHSDDVRLGPAEAVHVTAGATVPVTSASSSGIPSHKWAEGGKAASGGATPTPGNAEASEASGGESCSRCVTSLPSVPGRVRSRSVKVTVEGRAVEAEESGRGLPWLTIILTLFLIVLPLLLVVFIWVLRRVCSREPQEEGSGGEAAMSVGLVASEEEGGGHKAAGRGLRPSLPR